MTIVSTAGFSPVQCALQRYVGDLTGTRSGQRGYVKNMYIVIDRIDQLKFIAAWRQRHPMSDGARLSSESVETSYRHCIYDLPGVYIPHLKAKKLRGCYKCECFRAINHKGPYTLLNRPNLLEQRI